MQGLIICCISIGIIALVFSLMVMIERIAYKRIVADRNKYRHYSE